ncbi:MAG: hypothetical protein FWH14_00010 [Oscillospiraceae bacterium]|nr:hypothetical protein [Oscillospiraceae bacterium]
MSKKSVRGNKTEINPAKTVIPEAEQHPIAQFTMQGDKDRLIPVIRQEDADRARDFVNQNEK